MIIKTLILKPSVRIVFKYTREAQVEIRNPPFTTSIKDLERNQINGE